MPPKQVEEALEQALAQAKADAEAGETAAPTPVPPAEAVSEVVAEPEQPVSTTDEPAPDPAPQEDWRTEVAHERDRAALMEQRWKTLQGIHEALVREHKELQAQVADLQRQAQQPRETARPADDFSRYNLSASEIDDYSEVLPVIEKIAEAKAQELFAKRVSETEEQAVSTPAPNTEQTFFKTLNSYVPDWADLQKRPEWSGWCTKGVHQELINAKDANKPEVAAETYHRFREFCLNQKPKQTTAIRSQLQPSARGTAPTVPQPVKPFDEGEYKYLVEQRAKRGMTMSAQEQARLNELTQQYYQRPAG